MTALFLKLLNMSISASWLVLAVLLLRLVFRKSPKWISCLLWSIVALRLIIPFSFESVFSLIPSAQVIPQNIATTQTPAIYSGIPSVNSAVNPLFTQYLTPEKHTLETILLFASDVWLAGVAVLLLYSAVTYWRLRWQVQASIQLQNNLYICDHIDSPFILGTLFPRIYIPSGIDNGQLQYVLAHENAHIRRLDHWWKPLGFLLLTLYWFNPLLWLAYILLCRDIERACDEKVITKMNNAGKKAYSEALVACSIHRRLVMVCPVAFGEVAVKARIKGILRYKKPSFWIILAAAVVCAVTAVCFLTNPIPCVHTYTGEITASSTCTQKGIQTFTCPLCDHSYTARADLLAHDFRQGNILTEPDCTHTGSRELVCAGCGAEKTEVMEKTAHTLGTPLLTKKPNCVETGEMTAVCTLCQSVHVVEIVAPNHDHDLHETVVKEAACEIPGEGSITCSRCDYEQSCTYDPHGHNYIVASSSPGTCIRNGVQSIRCTVCDDSYVVSLPKANEHYWISSGVGPVHCIHCGTIKPGSSSQWGYGSGCLIANPFFFNHNQQPQYPGFKWDVGSDMSPVPSYPSVP